jgi:hypothetical protein
MSFVAPILVMGSFFLLCFSVSYLPVLETIGSCGSQMLIDFLAVFGTGYPLQGVLVISLTCALVGGLFDLFNFYCYQNMETH